MQIVVHYFFHLIFPAFIAYIFYRRDWKRVYLLFLCTMAIDLDHLLATPIYDPMRCSVGFHPLHSFYAIPVYVACLFVSKLRVISIGLLFHVLTDTIDCLWLFERCRDCYVGSRIHQLVGLFH
jgi:hypothetical protein